MLHVLMNDILFQSKEFFVCFSSSILHCLMRATKKLVFISASRIDSGLKSLCSTLWYFCLAVIMKQYAKRLGSRILYNIQAGQLPSSLTTWLAKSQCAQDWGTYQE